MKKLVLAMMAVGLLLTVSCKEEETYVYKDGTYKAEEASYHYNWKGFLEVTIKNDKFTAVDFDYYNADMVRKSETTPETYPMTPHPSVWLPELEAQLLAAKIAPEYVEVDGVTGATGGSDLLDILAGLILEAALTGDTETIIYTAPVK